MGRGVDLRLGAEAEITDGHREGAVVVVGHGEEGVRVFLVTVLDKAVDDAFLAGSGSLDYSNTLTNNETLSNLESSDFDFKWLGFICFEGDKSITDFVNVSLAIFELAINDLDPIPVLNLKLRIILNRQLESFVIKKIPFILIIIINIIK